MINTDSIVKTEPSISQPIKTPTFVNTALPYVPPRKVQPIKAVLLTMLVLLTIIGGISAYYLSQNSQDLRQQAYGDPYPPPAPDPGGGGGGSTPVPNPGGGGGGSGGSSPVSAKKGDLNADGKVDIYDYNIMLEQFGKTGAPGFHPADIIKNGIVDIFDYNELIASYGT